MEPALEALHARVKERVSAQEFERLVAEAREAFGGLLDDEAVGLLVLDELGLNEGAYTTLAELANRSEATARVKVERVEPMRTFERAGRDPGRVANIVVSDATGESRLVLWDRDVEKLDELELRPGVHLTVVNARVKPGRGRPELHVGPWTVLEVEGALDPARRKLLADVAENGAAPTATRTSAVVQTRLAVDEGPTELAGTLAWVSPTRPFRTPEGTTDFTCDIDIETSGGLQRIVVWGSHVRAVRALQQGGQVQVTALTPKVKGATTEWHTTGATTINAP